VEIIAADMDRGILAEPSDVHYKRIRRHHVSDACRPLFAQVYENLPESGDPPAVSRTSRASQGHVRASKPRPLTVSLWHKFFKPPYGGGNQFMLALRKSLQKSGVDVRENELNEGIDAYVLNSVQFDVEAFRSLQTSGRLNIVHRIDGPIYLIRGFDREKDEFCFELNDTLASATVIQSAWTFQRIVEMGYRPRNPVIIHNGVDPAIFHSRGRGPFRRGRKVRLISTSWSNNPRKGGPIYKWIEENLDWDRFEYTFVGNVSQPFDRVNHIPALPSEELADLLRQHDIYITASSNDPCSNALLEALACGLPALYLNDGGHPELVGYGGLPFGDTDDILPQLNRLVQDYEMFQNLICVLTIDTVAEKYLDLIRRVTQ
jgi:glycosyltransferase involved in cell wall biosynthesis